MPKIKFNIKNVHYARETQTDIYDSTPTQMPGAISVALDIDSSETVFWADGLKYYVVNTVNGYKGDLTVAKLADIFRKEVLGEILDSKKVLIETNKPINQRIALGFEIETDKKSELFWFYGVTCGKPSVSGKTTEGSNDPETETISINVAGLSNGLIRVRTTQETDEETRRNWFNSVYMKTDSTELGG